MWLVEMDQHPLTDKKKGQLKQWLKVSPEHAQVFRETALVYDQAEILSVLSDIVPLDKTQPAEVKAVAGWQPAKWAIAATIVLSVSLFFSLEATVTDKPPQIALYSTEVGGREVVQLDDGSSITLNTDTSLQVDFSAGLRKVILKRGEAFFEVAKDPNRPFTVAAGHGQVTAVGTAFSVYRRSGDIEVTVTEGRVRVEPEQISTVTDQAVDRLHDSVPAADVELAGVVVPTVELFLERGQVAHYGQSTEQIVVVEPDVISRKMMWQQGMLAFEGESLESVIEQFSRFTNLTITIADEELKAITVDGYFNSDDIAGMLTSLKLNFGIEIVQLDKDTISLN